MSTKQLTMRENEVLDLVCRGLKDREIADSMCLSRKTIRVFIHNLFVKFEADNRTHLTRKALTETYTVKNRRKTAI